MIHRFALAAVSLLLASAPALAGEYNGPGTFSWTYVPAGVLELGPNRYNTIGQVHGVATHPEGAPAELANLSLVCNSYDLPDGSGGGVCIAYDLSGDHYIAEFKCAVPLSDPPPPGVIAVCKGEDTLSGGTGKFANMKGKATFTQYVTGALPDGTYLGYSVSEQDLNW